NGVIRSQINKDQKELDKYDAQNDALKNGSNVSSIIGQLSNLDPPVKTSKEGEEEVLKSIADLDHELLIWTRQRGRIWPIAKPISLPNAQTGAVAIPTPAGIKPQTVVYLFEDSPRQAEAANAPAAARGPQYLGEFSVVQVGPQQTTLQPA